MYLIMGRLYKRKKISHLSKHRRSVIECFRTFFRFKDGKNVKEWPELKDRCSESNDKVKFTLSLHRAVQNDAGNYTCRAQNTEDESDTAEAEFIVQGTFQIHSCHVLRKYFMNVYNTF